MENKRTLIDPLNFPLELVVDTENRPLREQGALKALQDKVDMELLECSYPGSRHKHQKPMNVSALRQLNAHWDEILSDMQDLRKMYDKPKDHIRYVDLWRLSGLGRFLPAYLIYKQSDAIAPDKVPAHLAGLFKILVGLNFAVLRFMAAHLPSDLEMVERPVDINQFYSFVESKELLIGPRQVCAGPEAMIKKMIETLITDTGENRSTRTPEKLTDMIDSRDRFLEFAYCMLNMEILSQIFSALTETLHSWIREELLKKTKDVEWLIKNSRPDEAIFASLEVSAIEKILDRTLDLTIAKNYPSGEALYNSSRILTELWKFPSAQLAIVEKTLHPSIRTQTLMTHLMVYIRLEAIFATLSSMLKEQCLKSLSTKERPAPEIWLLMGCFTPPNLQVSNLFGTLTGRFRLP